jgi:hypothetical protein
LVSQTLVVYIIARGGSRTGFSLSAFHFLPSWKENRP